MKKYKEFLSIPNFLILIGILLACGFLIRLCADYYQIQAGIHSAPFSLFVLERSLEFLLPCVVSIIIAMGIKKREQKNKPYQH